MARLCEHPDAKWLVALFPRDDVSQEAVRAVMEAEGDDARALYIAWSMGQDPCEDLTLLRRAGQLGYAPAQADLVLQDLFDELLWAEKAAYQGERWGWLRLAGCYHGGLGVEVSLPKEIAALKEAAELDLVHAMFHYGKLAYKEDEWERYFWWARALDLGFAYYEALPALLGLIPSFERGELGRILFTVAPAVRGAVGRDVFSPHIVGQEQVRLQRLFALYDAVRSRAKAAVDCWSVVAQRCGVVKDVRVMIARLAWEEAWRWVALSPLSASSQMLPTSS
jgi:hypothetical protein